MSEQSVQSEQENLALYLNYSAQSRTIQEGIYKGQRKHRRKGIHHVALFTEDEDYLLDKSEYYLRVKDFDEEVLLERMPAFLREYASRSERVPKSVPLTEKTQPLRINAEPALKFMLYHTVLFSGKEPQKLAKKAKISDYKLEKVLSFDRRSSLQRIIDVFRACGKDLKISCTAKDGEQLHLSDYMPCQMHHVFNPGDPSMGVLIFLIVSDGIVLEFDIHNCCTVREARSAVKPKLIDYFNECIVNGWDIPCACLTVDDDSDLKFTPVRRCCLQEPLKLDEMLKAFEVIGSPLEITLMPKGEAEIKRTQAELDKILDQRYQNHWYKSRPLI